jgi:hypothetical protein
MKGNNVPDPGGVREEWLSQRLSHLCDEGCGDGNDEIGLPGVQAAQSAQLGSQISGQTRPATRYKIVKDVYS